MAQRPLHVGIDLGTTNSAVAVFDGETTQVVRNAQGATLTPSVVRIDARGRVTIGATARKFLERDSDNTKSEFKRLMGTERALEFPATGRSATPQELSAEILRALRNDVQDQLGALPVAAVISVPALFELPQSAATAEAAKLAGFDRVELLQEPIASALAAGWSADQGDGRWLVYDLGGGTFDASLLETDAGFLRVVGHDGDNFLGGRDFDWAIVDWAIAEIEKQHAVALARSNPAHATAIAQLKLAGEEAKIQLSRADEAMLVLPGPLAIPGGAPIEPELALDRSTLESLIAPVIERSIEVCRRLLHEHGTESSKLARIVFVGGPTVTPLLRQRVGESLGAPIADGLDPMTLVAQGAAIYAATAALDGRPAGPVVRRGCRLWLQYPAVSSDLTPHVVGRVIEGEGGPMPARVRVVRDDGWSSEAAVLDDQRAFATMVELVPRKANAFTIEADDGGGNAVPVDPRAFTIVQGLTITDPPLARSIGVALASDHVQIYFERGAPLPARRTFTQTTVESVARGSSDTILKIPIVQGEHDRAHLCRLVGTLEIPGHALQRTLPAGSDVELTIELDRGGRLAARALVPALDRCRARERSRAGLLRARRTAAGAAHVHADHGRVGRTGLVRDHL
ncbi:MAG TPA: Hsp70 family protein, partial [Nannocystaceae bacterium]|nr:Hsp70 family protein [Nannocystaceae bacterium]